LASDSPETSSPPPLRAKRFVKPLVFVVFASVIVVGLIGLSDEGILTTLAEREAQLRETTLQYPLLVYGAAFLIYVAVTGLSLPGATVLSLSCAWLFGFWPALVLVSFASTTGATLAFLLSRYLFREALVARFGSRLEAFNAALAREGAWYLFTLRLIVVAPFWVVNLVMGLTPIRVRTFWWVSQLGMLPGTIVFVWAGSSIPTLNDMAQQGVGSIFKPQLIAAFVALGLFPLVVKYVVRWVRRARRGMGISEKGGSAPKRETASGVDDGEGGDAPGGVGGE
jgi:uncharacterized membrane protein YdjX (TVP38/TMEM64 family)